MNGWDWMAGQLLVYACVCMNEWTSNEDVRIDSRQCLWQTLNCVFDRQTSVWGILTASAWCLSREREAWASRINGLHSSQAEGKKFHQNLEQRTISLRQEHRQQHQQHHQEHRQHHQQQQRRRRPGRGQTNISERLPSILSLYYSLFSNTKQITLPRTPPTLIPSNNNASAHYQK